MECFLTEIFCLSGVLILMLQNVLSTTLLYTCIVSAVDSFILDTCTNTIIPLVVKFCQGALQDEDSTLPVVSRHLGRLCHGLSPYMTDKQKAWFLDFYKKLCAMGVNDSSLSERNSDINDNLTPKVFLFPAVNCFFIWRSTQVFLCLSHDGCRFKLVAL